jgi:hypothetical protein
MKKTKLFLMIVSLLVTISLLAETPNVILQRESGGDLTMAIGLATAGDIQVDWGDGTLIPATAGSTNSTANITGTVSGTNTIKLYGPITTLQVTNSSFTTLITAADVSNAPALVKFVLPRNKLTALDLSNNPNVRTVSIYNNNFDACNLDAFYKTLPVITNTGTITLYNNIGHHTSKTSIAVDKGWAIYNNQFGDGTGCLENAVDKVMDNRMYVNYANNKLQISQSLLNGGAKMEVFSISGEKLINQNILLDADGLGNVYIDKLFKGLYLLRLSDSSVSVSSKFIVK